MTPRTLLAAPAHSLSADAALTLLRIVAGVAMMMHGWGKIQNPFNWMGPMSSTPGILQALAAISEFGGGAAWVLGLLTPLFSFGIACTMAVAAYTHAITRGDPFVAKMGGPSYELASLFFCIAIVLLFMGPGRLSVDRALFGRRK